MGNIVLCACMCKMCQWYDYVTLYHWCGYDVIIGTYAIMWYLELCWLWQMGIDVQFIAYEKWWAILFIRNDEYTKHDMKWMCYMNDSKEEYEKDMNLLHCAFSYD